MEYATMTVKELRNICREKGVTGYSRLRKADLIKLLSSTPLRNNMFDFDPLYTSFRPMCKLWGVPSLRAACHIVIARSVIKGIMTPDYLVEQLPRVLVDDGYNVCYYAYACRTLNVCYYQIACDIGPLRDVIEAGLIKGEFCVCGRRKSSRERTNYSPNYFCSKVLDTSVRPYRSKIWDPYYSDSDS